MKHKIPCPHCGFRISRVIGTQPGDDINVPRRAFEVAADIPDHAVWRERCCLLCHQVFYTLEQLFGTYPAA